MYTDEENTQKNINQISNLSLNNKINDEFGDFVDFQNKPKNNTNLLEELFQDNQQDLLENNQQKSHTTLELDDIFSDYQSPSTNNNLNSLQTNKETIFNFNPVKNSITENDSNNNNFFNFPPTQNSSELNKETTHSNCQTHNLDLDALFGQSNTNINSTNNQLNYNGQNQANINKFTKTDFQNVFFSNKNPNI